jgi:RES domain-containing protein
MSAPPARKQPSLLKAFRIVKRKFASTAFSGEGARVYGGRWNSPGVAVVYTSSTIALAILEWRAHLTQWPAPPVMIIEIEFSPVLVDSPSKLPNNWKQLPAPKANAAVGDSWAKSGKSAILQVPSAIVPDEFNYLLNPLHLEFPRIIRGKPRLLKVDARLGPLAAP